MALSTPAKPAAYTAEDLERLAARGYRYELVRGELRSTLPNSGLQGSSASRFSFYVGRVIVDGDLGAAFAVRTGFLVGRDPDIVLAPDLVQETRTPDNTKSEVSAKVVLWLELGVK